MNEEWRGIVVVGVEVVVQVDGEEEVLVEVVGGKMVHPVEH
jgi:hypothetical protein